MAKNRATEMVLLCFRHYSFDGHMTFSMMHAKDGEFVVEYEGEGDNIKDEVDGTADISDVAN